MSEQHKYEIKADPDDAAEEKQDLKGKSKKLLDDLDDVVGEVNKAVRQAVGRGSEAAAALGENVKHTLKDTMQGERPPRSSVVMVRVDADSLARLDELVEAGLCASRSEAAHHLITEGIQAKRETFEMIRHKVEEIRRAKQELRDLLRQDADSAKE